MPKAFEHIPASGNEQLFIFGDHASRFIPKAYDNLGLSGDDLTRHIAWDIGTESILRNLCAYFKCAGQLASVSRLVIDLNRDLDVAGLIATSSDETTIPGNLNLTPAQRQARIEQFYAPYHNELARQLSAPLRRFAVSLHSFTPKPRGGARRLTQIGLLAKHDMLSAEQFKREIGALGLNAAINKPYSAYDLNHSVDAHIAPRGLAHLVIEIRQDLIDNPAGIARLSNLLIKGLESIVKDVSERDSRDAAG